MKLQDVNSCCTAKLLAGFGANVAALPPNHYNGQEIGNTEQELLNAMLTLKHEGKAVVIAFTNDQQKEGNKLLRKVGFKSTFWMSKTQHPETRLKLWWFNLERLEG